jgi:integrase
MKQRKKGTMFEATVRFRGRKLSKSFSTHGEAAKWVNERRFLRDRGRPAFVEAVTIADLYGSYYQWAKEKNLTMSTLKLAESRFNKYLKPWFGAYNMAVATKEWHQAFLNHLAEKKKTPALRNRLRSLLQVMYSVAIRNESFNGAFKTNPLVGIQSAEEPVHAVKFWTKEEKHRFLEANADITHHRLFFFLLHTGVRINEALGSSGDQIDRGSQLFTLDRQFNLAENKIVFHTKGKKIRAIYLIDDVIENLDPISHGSLFPGVNYFHFVKKIFPAACARAEVRNIGPHGTRHTFAAHYLMDGGSLWDLSKILGHSSTDVTEKRYGHFDLAHVRGRMKVIERQGNVVRAQFG